MMFIFINFLIVEEYDEDLKIKYNNILEKLSGCLIENKVKKWWVWKKFCK